VSVSAQLVCTVRGFSAKLDHAACLQTMRGFSANFEMQLVCKLNAASPQPIARLLRNLNFVTIGVRHGLRPSSGQLRYIEAVQEGGAPPNPKCHACGFSATLFGFGLCMRLLRKLSAASPQTMTASSEAFNCCYWHCTRLLRT